MIQINGLNKSLFGGGHTVKILNGIDLIIPSGQFVAITGASGSGKTTLLSLIAGLDEPTEGNIKINDQDITKLNEDELAELRSQHFGFIFQNFNLIPTLTALENVALSAELNGTNGSKKKSMELLSLVGLANRNHHYPSQLSGGEQQRLALARAFINEPSIVLADEPTGALDPITSREVLQLFKQLHVESDVAFLLVTHNREVASFCERSLELREGRFIAQHGTDVDIGDLSDSRELIIDDTGTITLPPDVLLGLGGPGRFEMSEMDRDFLHLERVDEDKESVSSGNNSMVLSPNCPACKYDYADSDIQLCPECGSSRPMI